jgi:hypothetical protein
MAGWLSLVKRPGFRRAFLMAKGGRGCNTEIKVVRLAAGLF